MSELQKLTKPEAGRLAFVLHDAMRDALKLTGQIATTKHMITSEGIHQGPGRGVLPNISAPVDPIRLTMRSARLARSLVRTENPENILQVIAVSSDEIHGRLGTRVPYAPPHEFGATTRPHVIVPRRKKALRFLLGDELVIRRRVNHPGSVIPPRPFLAPTVADPDLQRGVQNILATRVKGELAASMRAALGGA